MTIPARGLTDEAQMRGASSAQLTSRKLHQRPKRLRCTHPCRRDELVLERNRLYDVEAFLSTAGRVLIHVTGEPISADTWGDVRRTCEDVRLRTEELQPQVDEIDFMLARGRRSQGTIGTSRCTKPSFLFVDGDRTALEHWAHQDGLEPTGLFGRKRTTQEELCRGVT